MLNELAFHFRLRSAANEWPSRSSARSPLSTESRNPASFSRPKELHLQVKFTLIRLTGKLNG